MNDNRWTPPPWIPDLPPPLVACIWALVLICLTLGAYIESVTAPAQPWWLNIWKGSLGGNGITAASAIIAISFLTSEVFTMIFTLRHNQVQREKAEKAVADAVKNADAIIAAAEAEKAAAEAEKAAAEVVRATAEAEKAAAEAAYRQAVTRWYNQLKAAQAAGQPFDEPPPGYIPNGNSPE